MTERGLKDPTSVRNAVIACVRAVEDLAPEARFRVLSAVAVLYPLTNDLDPSMRVNAAASMLEVALSDARKGGP